FHITMRILIRDLSMPSTSSRISIILTKTFVNTIIMRKTLFFLTVVCFTVLSCTKEKTDYEAEIDVVVPTYDEFEEAVNIHSGDYDISIEALNGTFYKGYNEIRLKIMNSQTGKEANATDVTFLPVTTEADGNKSSCPHRYDLAYT